jgi:3-hydroxybutyryl-CoA dehydrogenase
MGAQIALQSAVFGHAVRMTDTSAAGRERARAAQAEELDRRVRSGAIGAAVKAEVLARIQVFAELERAAAGAEVAIEAVSENRDLKRAVFADLDRACPRGAIIATNSSSIRVSTIEDATRRPEKVLNAHFIPPVWQRPMVELMRGTRTSDETIERMRRFARSIDLTPLIVQKESTGFIFNRVWRAVKKEALRLVDQGVASHEDVDRAWMIVFGGSTGPFGLMDLVGLDVVRDIELVYHGESGDASDTPPKLLLDKIARGELGRKSGKGFYNYPNPAFGDPAWLRRDG